MALIWRQSCYYGAKEQDRLGVAALEAGDVVAALLHLRAAVRLDCNIQLRLERAEVYERVARLWSESAEVRDEIRRREDIARKPGRWLYELTPRNASDGAATSIPTETEPKMKPLFFVRPAGAAAGEALADKIADGLIEQINASRLAKGLPPLEDD